MSNDITYIPALFDISDILDIVVRDVDKAITVDISACKKAKNVNPFQKSATSARDRTFEMDRNAWMHVRDDYPRGEPETIRN